MTRKKTRFEADMDTGMARMIQAMHSPGYTGQRDADFLAMLIPHHEGVADMARPVLIPGRDSVVWQIAEVIIASQRVDRRDARADGGFARGAPKPGPSGYPALGAVRGGG